MDDNEIEIETNLLAPIGLMGALRVYFSSLSGNDFDLVMKSKTLISLFWNSRRGIYKLNKYQIYGSIAIMFCIFLLETNSYELLVRLNEIVLSVTPNLLGFNLGAYTLYITFGGQDFILKFTKFKNKRHTFYQKNSATFAVCLIIQLLTIIYSFVISICLNISFYSNSKFISNSVNFLSIFILLLLGFISIYLLKYIIINIYNISQTYHFHIIKESNRNNNNNQSPE